MGYTRALHSDNLTLVTKADPSRLKEVSAVLLKRFVWLILLVVFVPSRAHSQWKFQKDPIPSDPLELATGPIHLVETQEQRVSIVALLGRAREAYRLRSGGNGYKLKASFTADSHGMTHYDGYWEMEEVHAPGVGTRWKATAAGGYSTTRIDTQGLHYAEGTPGEIPLVLNEARGAFEGPIASADFVSRRAVRTTSATYHGVSLTCVLYGNTDDIPKSGRGWDEAEECIDPQTGLLRTHSLMPGRYAVYDYTDALDFDGHVLPRKITITEAGSPVIDIRVESLEDDSAPDPSLFVPTSEMKANGAAVVIEGQDRVPMFHDHVFPQPGSLVHPVIIFGLLTSTGQIVDAHPLEPSDPKSDEALADIAEFKFADRTPPGGVPKQRQLAVFVYFSYGQ
jgi:hypothetical protein